MLLYSPFKVLIHAVFCSNWYSYACQLNMHLLISITMLIFSSFESYLSTLYSESCVPFNNVFLLHYTMGVYLHVCASVDVCIYFWMHS